MIFELWESDEGYMYFPRDENYADKLALLKNAEPEAKQIWSYDAKSYNEAQQARHEYLGFEAYKPELDWEDIVYE